MAFVKQFSFRCPPSPGASLGTSGVLTFGSTLRQQFPLTPGRHVSIHFDPESRCLGLELHEPGEAPVGSAKIFRLRSGSGVSIGGIANRCGIRPGRFSFSFDHEQKLIVLTPVTEKSA